MRRVLEKPTVRTALCVGLLLVAVEAMLYFERHRHATIREILMVFAVSVAYFGVVETLVPFSNQRLGLSLFLSMNGFQSMLSHIERAKETTWGGLIGRTLLGAVLFGFVGASIDAVSEHRRRPKEQS